MVESSLSASWPSSLLALAHQSRRLFVSGARGPFRATRERASWALGSGRPAAFQAQGMKFVETDVGRVVDKFGEHAGQPCLRI